MDEKIHLCKIYKRLGVIEHIVKENAREKNAQSSPGREVDKQETSL